MVPEVVSTTAECCLALALFSEPKTTATENELVEVRTYSVTVRGVLQKVLNVSQLVVDNTGSAIDCRKRDIKCAYDLH